MRCFLILLFITISTCVQAKSDNFSDTVYYDAELRKIKKKYASFYRIPTLKVGEKHIASFYRVDGKPYKVVTYLPQRVDYHWSIEEGVGIKDGMYIYFNPDGDTVEEGQYKQNQKVGEWRYYWGGRSRLLSIEYYYEGQHCLYQTNYRWSQTKGSEGMIKQYLKGFDTVFSKTGMWTFYFKGSDTIEKVLNYEYGLFHGRCTYYDRKTGKKIKEGWYKHDRRDSTWLIYDREHGMLAKQITYNDGYKNGPLLAYYIPSGRKELETMYYWGKRIGSYREYYDYDSLLKVEGYFKDGESDFIFYDSVTREKYCEGHVIDEERSGQWKYYYKGGAVRKIINYQAGERHGVVTAYDKNGSPLRIDEYKNDKRNGVSKFFYEGTDKLWFETEIENDTISGKRICYYRSGKVKRNEIFKNGDYISGTCYDENGVEIKCTSFSYKPGFKGDVMTYIGNNLRYPEDALDARIEGKVVVGFTIAESGNVTDVRIVKGIDNSCDDEAIRLVSEMPPWVPAYIDETPISYSMTLPIVFWIQEE